MDLLREKILNQIGFKSQVSIQVTFSGCFAQYLTEGHYVILSALLCLLDHLDLLQRVHHTLVKSWKGPFHSVFDDSGDTLVS